MLLHGPHKAAHFLKSRGGKLSPAEVELSQFLALLENPRNIYMLTKCGTI